MQFTNRQRDIIEAAIQIISRQGFKDLTIKNLAAGIGLSEAALYRHFASKNELIQAMLDYFADLSGKVIEDIQCSGLIPTACIERFVISRFDLFEANPDLGNVLFSEELFRNDPALMDHMRSIMHGHRNAVVGYITAAQQMGHIDSAIDPVQLFRIIIGSMRFLVTQWNISGHSFSLIDEGRALIETLKKLIEVKQ
jgi:AcrR family transcriptional regulator